MQLVYLAIYIVIGLALDWAMFWRAENSIGMAGLGESRDGYFDLLFPRILITLASIVVIFYAGRGGRTSALMVVCGGALFLLSSFYAFFRLLRGQRR